MAESTLAKDLILEIGEPSREGEPLGRYASTSRLGQTTQSVTRYTINPGEQIHSEQDIIPENEIYITDVNLIHSEWGVSKTTAQYEFQKEISSNGGLGGGNGYVKYATDNEKEKYTVELVVRDGVSGSLMSFTEQSIPESNDTHPEYNVSSPNKTKGMSLYCYPTENTDKYNSNITLIFDVAEGDGCYLYVRGPGNKNLFDYIIEECNLKQKTSSSALSYLMSLRCVLSPFIHSASITY